MKKILILSLVVFAVGLSPAKAELITIAIEATVDEVWDLAGHLEGNISEGDLITGYYIYESTTMDSNPSSTVGEYWHYNAPAGIYLTVGGFEFETDSTNVNFLLGISNSVSGWKDVYWLDSNNNLDLSNGVAVEDIIWQLDDSTGTALSSDVLPTTAPVLSDWDHNRLAIEGGPRGVEFGIDAIVTSAVVIPEPATILLLAFGAAILKRRLS